MCGNEAMTNNIIYSTYVWTTECWIADADPQNILEPPTEGCARGLISTWYVVTIYDSARSITSRIQKRLDKFKEI